MSDPDPPGSRWSPWTIRCVRLDKKSYIATPC